MRYPIVSDIPTSKEMLTNFQGYDNRIGCLEGSFHDELNVTADHYPTLSTRNKRHKASNDVPYNTQYNPLEKHYVNTAEYQGWAETTADRIFNTSDGNELISIKVPTAEINYPLPNVMHPVAITYADKRVYVGDPANFGNEKLNINENPNRKVIRMGAKLCMFPDNLWINVDGDEVGEFATLDDFIATAKLTTIENCNAEGEPISDKLHDEQYYKDNPEALVSGAYMMTTNSNGDQSIKVYSDLSKSWATVTSTFIAYKVEMDAETRKADLKEGDGIIIRSRPKRTSKSGKEDTVEGLDKILLTEDKDFTNGDRKLTRGLDHITFGPGTAFYKDDDPYYSMTSPIRKLVKKTISNKEYLFIVVPGIIRNTITIPESWGICFAREVPKMSHIVECQNRLWGCAVDGHEIYCCKIGDPTNWYYYAGTAADSYAATVGSSGVFTGAIAYNQNPIFFKENSFLKVSVSASGAHSYRVQDSEGVEKTSAKSLVNVEGVLYYLNSNGVYAYDGSTPQKISEAFGNHRYMNGIGGKLNGKYYLSVLENDGTDASREGECKHTLFVFDTFKGIWTKEASNEFIISDIYCTAESIYFTRLLMNDGHKNYETWCEGVHKFWNSDDFYYGSAPITRDEGTEEADFKWFVESAPIGYAMSNNKYVGRINLRLSIAIGSYVDFWMKYDNDTQWTHIFNMSGKGTKSFIVPVTPKRCDNFKYKISGKGDCKVISVTKTIEEGSDV